MLFIEDGDKIMIANSTLMALREAQNAFRGEAERVGLKNEQDAYQPPVQYVNRLMEHSWGQKVIRFYDPDGNLIEVGTPM